MANPYQKLTLRDPGIGAVPSGQRLAAFAGTAFSGTVGQVLETNDPAAVLATFTRGPLVVAMLYALAIGAGPVRGVRVTGSVTGTVSAVTHTGAGAAVMTVTGAADEKLSVIVEVTKAGALGVGEVRYALDNWALDPAEYQPTWSPSIVVPASGEVVLEGTPHTVDFSLSLTLGDADVFTTEPAHYGNTEIGAAFDALGVPAAEGWDHVCFVGHAALAATAATNAAAIGTRLISLFENDAQYVAALFGGGKQDVAAFATAFAAAQVRFGSVGHLYGYLSYPQTRRAFGTMALGQHEVAAALASVHLISTDLARTANGPIPGMVGADYDAAVEGDAADNSRLSTFRSWKRFPGWYINNQRLLTNPESDFQFWQNGVCMLVACDITYRRQWKYMSSGLRTQDTTGYLDAGDKSDVQGDVDDGLAAGLLAPTNAEGKPGHVSAVGYELNGTLDLNTTKRVEGTVRMRPLGYVKEFETVLQYAKTVGGAS